jgi:2-keto-4-pentenoate hydratase/2-oxohepta-3-ene-1,7-dioic acid hydratase in catechol pathway
MKIVVFGDARRVGALRDEHIVDLNRADAQLPSRLDELIAAGQSGLEAARRALQRASGDARVEARSVRLHAPWAGKRLAMMGANFADHLAGMAANRNGTTVDDDAIKGAHKEARTRGQWGFWKVLDEVAGDGDDVPFPSKRTAFFDYEGEVAIVVGKRGKDIPASAVRDYVWGVTLANDWSCRDNMGTPAVVSYNRIKNFDRACSLGPCILVGEGDCQEIDLETRVNGGLRQKYNSREMIFSFGEALEFLSSDFTFVPGDVVCGGTAAGTAADKSKRNPDGSLPKDLFLKVGDVVEISSSQIGKMRNKVV